MIVITATVAMRLKYNNAFLSVVYTMTDHIIVRHPDY